MIKNFALTLIFTLFVSSSLYAACSKKEIVQFVELGFTKEEIKQICEDDSIDFGKDQSEANEVEEADEETSENKESVNDRNDEVESIRTDPESRQETLQQARQSTKQGRSQIFFEIGGMNGKYSMKSSDEIVREYSGDLDHDLSGAMFSLGYQYKFDSNMLVGLGYQSFNLEGESKEVSKTFFSGGLYFPDFQA
jgi:DNA-binding transcriptional MerR regulator